ncbi:hypothetical protein BDR22DRAFT_803250 [Usnea florida]
MTTSNYSIYAIPAYFILALGPQLYSNTLIKIDTVNPRGTSFSESRKKSLDKATLARFERARSAHLNALENLPLFASAVICANIAGLEADLGNLEYCMAFLALRIAHSVAYITIETQNLAYIRSLAWTGSVVCCFTLLIKAGNVLVDGKGMKL